MAPIHATRGHAAARPSKRHRREDRSRTKFHGRGHEGEHEGSSLRHGRGRAAPPLPTAQRGLKGNRADREAPAGKPPGSGGITCREPCT